jgi:threonine synthase
MELVCQKCKKTYSHNTKIWKCECGGLLDVFFNSKFPIENIKKCSNTLWRYRQAIPILSDENIVSFNEGFTPIVEEKIQGKDIHLKLDYLFPSGSYKDRGATVMISKAKEQGVKRLVEDSSGNAGAAIAAYCAKAEIECEIFVPIWANREKLIQIELYGARLNKISGTREDTSDAAIKAAANIFYGSHVWNPYFLQGTKTFIFEIVEQLGWKVPDTIISPLGHGGLLLGTYLGLKDLMLEGIIERFPRLIGVQSEACAPLAYAYKNSLENYIEITKKETSIASGITIGKPVRAPQILEAIRKTDGEIITVSEDEIRCELENCVKRGYYIEPTSAVALAAVKEHAYGTTVVPLTGHGLKATDVFLKIFDV